MSTDANPTTPLHDRLSASTRPAFSTATTASVAHSITNTKTNSPHTAYVPNTDDRHSTALTSGPSTNAAAEEEEEVPEVEFLTKGNRAQSDLATVSIGTTHTRTADSPGQKGPGEGERLPILEMPPMMANSGVVGADGSLSMHPYINITSTNDDRNNDSSVMYLYGNEVSSNGPLIYLAPLFAQGVVPYCGVIDSLDALADAVSEPAIIAVSFEKDPYSNMRGGMGWTSVSGTAAEVSQWTTPSFRKSHLEKQTTRQAQRDTATDDPCKGIMPAAPLKTVPSFTAGASAKHNDKDFTTPVRASSAVRTTVSPPRESRPHTSTAVEGDGGATTTTPMTELETLRAFNREIEVMARRRRRIGFYRVDYYLDPSSVPQTSGKAPHRTATTSHLNATSGTTLLAPPRHPNNGNNYNNHANSNSNTAATSTAANSTVSNNNTGNGHSTSHSNNSNNTGT